VRRLVVELVRPALGDFSLFFTSLVRLLSSPVHGTEHHVRMAFVHWLDNYTHYYACKHEFTGYVHEGLDLVLRSSPEMTQS